jgi:hypothetical protein
MRFAVPAALTVAAGLLFVGAPSAQATGPVQFRRITYNAPGSDTTSNLNGEWVAIKNTATTTKCLTGWTVRDAQSHVYKFGSFCLGAGKTVNLHTGRGTNTSANRYWGLGWHVWNNTGDTAYLRNAAGTSQDSCAWGNGIGYVDC